MTQMKKVFKTIGSIFFLVMISSLLLFIKYRPAYSVEINGENLGYVSSKNDFQKEIDENILKTDEEGIAFIALDNVNYNFEFASRNMVDNSTTLANVSSKSTKIYRIYEVSSDNSEDTVYTKSEDEANNFVNNLKTKYDKVDANLKITVLYIEDEVSDETIQTAKANLENTFETKQNEIVETEKKKAAAAVAARKASARKASSTKTTSSSATSSSAGTASANLNGVSFTALPITSYTMSTRYGTVNRAHGTPHSGLDLAAPTGTAIYAAASGTVISASTSSGGYSGYGKLIKIDHGNGVQTWYAHCSSILVSSGQTVSAGQQIGRVGSTGYATGPHLHFEVRINGKTYNPQNWLY